MDDLFRRTDDGDPDDEHPVGGGGGAPVNTAALSAIFSEVLQERVRQDGKWGGPEHDDGHNPYDWLGFISDRIGKVRPGDQSPEGRAAYRRRMVQTAALAVAAIESHDRKEQHGSPA